MRSSRNRRTLRRRTGGGWWQSLLAIFSISVSPHSPLAPWSCVFSCETVSRPPFFHSIVRSISLLAHLSAAPLSLRHLPSHPVAGADSTDVHPGWGFNITLLLIFSRAINMIIIEERHDPDAVSMDPLPVMPSDSIVGNTFDDASVSGNVASLAPPSTYWTRRSCGIDRRKRTEYAIPLSPTSTVILRGTRRDLEAVTTCGFLSPMSRRQGLLEGVAKTFMYLAAALGGNLSQAGALIISVLLLVSATLLAISNFLVRCLRVNGRVVYPAPVSHQS